MKLGRYNFTFLPSTAAVGAVAGGLIGRSLIAAAVGGVLGGLLLAPLYMLGAMEGAALLNRSKKATPAPMMRK